MILIPDLMPFKFNVKTTLCSLFQQTIAQKLGVVILVSSDKNAERWSDVATTAIGSAEAEKYIAELQEKQICGPVVFSNRYDGINFAKVLHYSGFMCIIIKILIFESEVS